VKHIYDELKQYAKYTGLNEDEEEVLQVISGRTKLKRAWELLEKLQKNVQSKEITLTTDSLPSHYTKNADRDIPHVMKEPIFFITKYDLNFSEGCLLKYITRYKDKLPIQDLEKCKFYSDAIINGSYEKYQQYKLSLV